MIHGKMKALSIVYPGGQKIVSGLKTIEVRSWAPPEDLTDVRPITSDKKVLAARGIYEVEV